MSAVSSRKDVRSLPVIGAKVAEDASGHRTQSYAELLQAVGALQAQIAEKDAEIAIFKDELSTSERVREEAVAAADAAARQDERRKIEADSQAVIDRGIKSLEAGRKTFESFLQESEKLALMVAQTALRKVFVEHSSRGELVASAIARCMTSLSARSVVNVRLSSEDFGDPSEILAYEPELEKQNLGFEIDPTLPSGDCEFELLVGRLEISLDRHWSRLDELLTSLQAEGQAPEGVVPA